MREFKEKNNNNNIESETKWNAHTIYNSTISHIEYNKPQAKLFLSLITQDELST